MQISSLKVAAIMMVRDEQAVIATCVGHLLQTVGVDRVYVVDNGSSDQTPHILQRIADGTGRLVLRSDAGGFRQHEILTDLAQQAMDDGAEWVLPSDGDEFLWLRSGVPLQALCSRDDIGGYHVPVCNFLQARAVQHDGPRALLTMGVSAVPQGTVAEAQAAVTSGALPFIRMAYPTKLLLRLTREMVLGFGHHVVTGEAMPLVPLRTGEVLHAPIRSFADLRTRIESGQRVATVTPEAGQSWHLKRVAAMDERGLAEEWRRNSFRVLRPVQRGATRLDLRLCRVALRQRGFVRRFG